MEESSERKKNITQNPRKSRSLRRASSRNSFMSHNSESKKSLDPFDSEVPKKRNPMKEHPYERLFGKRVTDHIVE